MHAQPVSANPDLLLSVRHLACERGYRPLFDQLSFTLSRGQLLRIAGGNGSGKSTLLKVLAGLSSDYSGDILWQGEPVSQVRDQYQAGLCYLGHAKAVKQRLTVQENLNWFRALYPCEDAATVQDDVLKQLRLYRFRDQLCGQLSAGQQQRVALARLLISKASVWILDEPFTAIDKDGVLEFEQIIQDRVAAGTAVILTTHHALQVITPQQTIELGG